METLYTQADNLDYILSIKIVERIYSKRITLDDFRSSFIDLCDLGKIVCNEYIDKQISTNCVVSENETKSGVVIRIDVILSNFSTRKRQIVENFCISVTTQNEAVPLQQKKIKIQGESEPEMATTDSQLFAKFLQWDTFVQKISKSQTGIRVTSIGCLQLEWWNNPVFPNKFCMEPITKIEDLDKDDNEEWEQLQVTLPRKLPSTLEILILHHTKITKHHILPDTLKFLHLNDNVLSLPKLGSQLEVLILSTLDCKLKSFPNTLRTIKIRRCTVALPMMPPNLEKLELGSFEGKLGRLSETLCVLKLFHYNYELPALPIGLEILELANYTGKLDLGFLKNLQILKIKSYDGPDPCIKSKVIREIFMNSYFGPLPVHLPTSLQTLFSNGLNIDIQQLKKTRSNKMDDPSRYNNWEFCKTYLAKHNISFNEQNHSVSIDKKNLPSDFNKLFMIKKVDCNYVYDASDEIFSSLPSSVTSLCLRNPDYAIPKVFPPNLMHLNVNSIDFDVNDIKESRAKGTPDPSIYNQWSLTKQYLEKLLITVIDTGKIELTRSDRIPNDFDKLPITHITSKNFDGDLPALPQSLQVLVLEKFTDKYCTLGYSFPQSIPKNMLEMRLKSYSGRLPELPAGLLILETKDGIFDLKREKYTGNNCAQFLQSINGITLLSDGCIELTAEYIDFPSNFDELPILEISSKIFIGVLPKLPKTIRKLTLTKYNSENIVLPNELQYLKLDSYNGVIDKIPDQLVYLSLGAYTGPIQFLLYNYKIKELYLSKYNGPFKIGTLYYLEKLHLDSFNNVFETSKTASYACLVELIIPSFNGQLPFLGHSTKLALIKTRTQTLSKHHEIYDMRKMQRFLLKKNK
jgi:hypothetical protein